MGARAHSRRHEGRRIRRQRRHYAAYAAYLDIVAVKSWTIAIQGLTPVIVEAGTRLAEFGSTLERMSAWQNAHGIALDGSEAGTGDPSQTGVKAVRGSSVNAEWIDEIHDLEGRV